MKDSDEPGLRTLNYANFNASFTKRIKDASNELEKMKLYPVGLQDAVSDTDSYSQMRKIAAEFESVAPTVPDDH